jgi:hypothetical protein
MKAMMRARRFSDACGREPERCPPPELRRARCVHSVSTVHSGADIVQLYVCFHQLQNHVASGAVREVHISGCERVAVRFAATRP